MKYYLYISDSKVDMLFPQIGDAQKKKVANEIGFDVKLLHAKHKEEYSTNEDRIARLEAVVSFIRQFSNLGTVEEPNDYVEDAMPMYWRVLKDTSVRVRNGVKHPKQPDTVYFTGLQNDTWIGLGGSPKHTIGANPKKETDDFSSSLSPWGILDVLEAAEVGQTLDDWIGGSRLATVPVAFKGIRDSAAGIPPQNMRFMAKRLVEDGGFIRDEGGHETSRRWRIIVGSPLYVCMEDSTPT